MFSDLNVIKCSARMKKINSLLVCKKEKQHKNDLTQTTIPMIPFICLQNEISTRAIIGGVAVILVFTIIVLGGSKKLTSKSAPGGSGGDDGGNDDGGDAEGGREFDECTTPPTTESSSVTLPVSCDSTLTTRRGTLSVSIQQ